ncbi:MAG: hypothetical protein GVY10_07515 [Verrucomicrobia bacterium]|nr:hypothetical protein [Verrucomicrobiota bacterium]
MPHGHRKPLLSFDDLRRGYFAFDFPPPEAFNKASELLTGLCNAGPQEEVFLLALMEYIRLGRSLLEPDDSAEALASSFSFPALRLLRVLCDCWAGENPD